MQNVRLYLVILILICLCYCSQRKGNEALIQNCNYCIYNQCGGLLGQVKKTITKNQLQKCYTCLKVSERKLKKQIQTAESDYNRELKPLLGELEKHKLHLVNLRRDPSLYNLGGNIKQTLSQTDQPITYRLSSINESLVNASDFYESAKEVIYKPLAGKCRLAVQKQLLTMELLNGSLQDSLRTAPIEKSFQQTIQTNIDHAKLAVKDYLAFCESLWFIHQDSVLN